LRRLLSETPKHLKADGPKPNPFLPWEKDLEVSPLGSGHVLLLNKYPVQPAHVLVISQDWQPQEGWLSELDWQAVATVAGDTNGLWFFNSAPASGASQRHRHVQLLPRHAGEPTCPLEPWFNSQLNGEGGAVPWRHAISRRTDPKNHGDLVQLYRDQLEQLGLGRANHDQKPFHPYNLLFNDQWFMTIRREKEHCAGFSLNALGFAGYLLATDHSDLDWLSLHGPMELLRQVATPA
jgi:ATP adenylyltransferase